MNKLKAMLHGHSDEKTSDKVEGTAKKSNLDGGPARHAHNTGITSADSSSHGATQGQGTSSYEEGDPLSTTGVNTGTSDLASEGKQAWGTPEPDPSSTSGYGNTSASGLGSSGLASTVKDSSSSNYGDNTTTTGNILHRPNAPARDTLSTTSIKSGVQGHNKSIGLTDPSDTFGSSTGAGLTGTALTDRSVGTTGTTGVTSGETFVEPTLEQLGVDNTGGPHPTFTGNRLDPNFTEDIPNYHEEFAHGKGGSRGTGALSGPTGMAATTTYEDPNASSYTFGSTGASGLTTETTETTSAPEIPHGYESYRGYDSSKIQEDTTSGLGSGAAVGAGAGTAAFESEKIHERDAAAAQYTSDNEPRAYGQDGPNRFAEERGVTGGTGVPAHQAHIDSKTIPTTESSSSAYQSGSTTGQGYPEDYQTRSNVGQESSRYGGSSSHGASSGAAGAAGVVTGAEAGKLLYEHSKDTGLSESDKAAAVRAYEQEREDEESGSTQKGSPNAPEDQYGSIGGNRSDNPGNSKTPKTKSSDYEEDKTSKYEDKASKYEDKLEDKVSDKYESQSGSQSGYAGTRSGRDQVESSNYGRDTGIAAGAAGLGAAGAYEYEQSRGSSAPQGYESQRDYTSGNQQAEASYDNGGTSKTGYADIAAPTATTQGHDYPVGYAESSGRDAPAYNTAGTSQTEYDPYSTKSNRETSSSGYAGATSDNYASTGAAYETTGATGIYDPYAKETTTGPTGFATGFVGDSTGQGYSQPTSTEQYSQPTSTEQYSQPTSTQNYSQPTSTQNYSQPISTSTYDQTPSSSENYAGTTAPTSSAIGSTGGYAERQEEQVAAKGTGTHYASDVAGSSGTGSQAYGAYEDQRVDQPGHYTGTTQTANTEKRHGLSALLHREKPNKLRKDPPGGRHE